MRRKRGALNEQFPFKTTLLFAGGGRCYLKRIAAQNFCVFGGRAAAPPLNWTLSPGLNMLVGENDAGKSAVIDAIRHALWTTSYDYIRLQETDFHVAGTERATSLSIEATLGNLTPEQESAVLEWLSYGADGSTELVAYFYSEDDQLVELVIAYYRAES